MNASRRRIPTSAKKREKDQRPRVTVAVLQKKRELGRWEPAIGRTKGKSKRSQFRPKHVKRGRPQRETIRKTVSYQGGPARKRGNERPDRR